ncbi:HutI [Desulforapulum autotrophicum HRM2]|uniref:Imidazolonepropionase n=1 Tax=Desulforapulum autotrophicum (strain ATCC 43914 / DSM 3382 / VKM B-1955 / HRM2) TaxID=177437 RepID=C0QDV2_DESAH|nr:imidazolonepropionase [Desulforapulum autotrophicum]ACN17373.1 HutI [Desulforapulum autotrophicum HRM2]
MRGNLIIKNASQLVTCSGFRAKQGAEMSELGIIENGAVIVEKGMITAVGDSDDLLTGFNTEGFDIVDAAGKSVLPGFVDSHTHFVFAGYRPDEFAWRLRGDSYMDIMRRGGGIANTVKATRRAGKDTLISLGLKRLDTMLAFGVTTVEGKSGYGLDHDTEIKQLEVMQALNRIHPVDVAVTFLGAHATPAEFKGRKDAFIDLVVEMLDEVAERGLAQFCDVFCEKNVFSVDQAERLLMQAKTLGMGAKIHADEMVQLGGAELSARLKAVSADHLLQASDQGILAMARAGVVATLLPGTAFSLKEPYARARFMIDQGCAVALATDFNPGSCFSNSIPLMFALATLYMGMATEEAVTALTINGAAALNRADTIGSIDVGKHGDLVILEYPSYRFLPYHVGMNIVEKVVKQGNIVFSKA